MVAGARERGFVTLLAGRVASADPAATRVQDFVAFGVAGFVLTGTGGYAEDLERYGIATVEVLAGGAPADAATAGRQAVDSLTASFVLR